jgi:riboflavin kinase/FMN adenylyltransferase
MNHLSFDDNNHLKSCILSIGNFDGVHLGHKHLLNSMKHISKKLSIPSLILTFTPHTNEIIFNKETKVLTPLDVKLNELSKSKIDYLSVINFNDTFSKIDIDVFMSRIIEKYNPLYFFIGYDNKFGFRRKGSFEYFTNNKIYNHINFKSASPFIINKREVKSSIIKDMIKKGDMLNASKYLGYQFKILGKVVKGQGLGTKIGFPTANIDLKYKKQLIPTNGVYSVNLKLDKKIYLSICNIGFRPTVSNQSILSIEVHVLNITNIDLYDSLVEIEFIKKIRNEINFESVNHLQKQISSDIKLLKKENNG